ncbi:NAC domain-containing protein 68 [Linum grandiflorum]
MDGDSEEDAYFASLTANLTNGFRFHPTFKELICEFLMRKIRRGDAVDEEDQIKEFDGYSAEPWDLWSRFSEDEMVDLYFYTKLKRKPSSGKIDRGVAGGKGRWRGETDKEKIRIQCMQQQVVTRSLDFEIRRFNYRNGENAEEDGRWIMIEYREKGAAASDWVIFRMRRNKEEAGHGNGSSSSSATESGDSTCTDDDEDDP